jgi:hypothetical protein
MESRQQKRWGSKNQEDKVALTLMEYWKRQRDKGCRQGKVVSA